MEEHEVELSEYLQKHKRDRPFSPSPLVRNVIYEV